MNNETYTSIPLGGITRNTPFFNAPDGDMAEAINLRYRHGKVYPVGAPVERTVLQGLDLLYLHKTDQYENAIVYESGGIYAYTITFDINGYETKSNEKVIVPEINKSNIKDISHIGNILIISSEYRFFIYLYESEKYSIIDIPNKLNIYAFAKDYTQLDTTDTSLSDISLLYHPIKEYGYEDKYRIVYSRTTHYYKSISSHEERSSINELFSNSRKDGHLYNPVLFRAAITLYDGRHISVSDPILIMGSAGAMTAMYKNKPQSVTLLPYDIYFYIFDDLFNIPRSIISGITLFIAEIDPYKDRDINSTEIIAGDWVVADIDSYAELYVLDGSENPPKKQFDDGIIAHTAYHYERDIFSKRIKSVSVYRKAAFIPLNNIQYGFLENKLQIENLQNIETAESLEISDGIEFQNANIYKYNEQIHIWNYKSSIPDINPLNSILMSENEGMFNATLGLTYPPGNPSKYTLAETFSIIKYKDAYGKERTKKSIKIDYFNFPIIGVNPFFSYNATSATSATIYYKIIVNDETKYYSKNFLLSESPLDNISYALQEDLSIYLSIIDQNSYDSAWENVDDGFYNISDNTLRVSETSNPFVFPVEKTYTLGQGQILGLAVATQPISQGQFGQYPLYAFCSDGIWALQVGNADTSYSVQAPVSFDVCNNARSITPVLGGIIFSTASGLKLLSGGQATRIDEPLDGATINAGQYPALTTLISTLYNTPGITDDTLFTTYLAEADITYNYREDELIIFNPRYPYTYVLSGGRWSKRAGQIQSAINNYPQVFLQKDNRWYDLTRESTTPQPMFFLTRPCKFGTTHYKRIGRSILRAYAHQAHINLLLLGSNDGTTFALVNKITTGARNRTDIHLGRGIKSYKYYAYAIAIEPQDESVLTCELGGIDLAFTQALNGFIR